MEGTGTNGAHEPKGRTKYKYITLAEAYDSFPGAEVNFYGIVAEWTVPRPTRKGTDMYQVLKLRDASVTDITSDGDGGSSDGGGRRKVTRPSRLDRFRVAYSRSLRDLSEKPPK